MTNAQQTALAALATDLSESGLVAYKHNDPTEGARWVGDESEISAIAAEDPSLIVWARDTLVTRDLAGELREFSPLGADEVEALIAANEAAIIVFADPKFRHAEERFPGRGRHPRRERRADHAVTAAELRKAEAAYQAASRLSEAEREKRNAAVRTALAEGWTHARVAKETGLTRARVGAIALHNRRATSGRSSG